MLFEPNFVRNDAKRCEKDMICNIFFGVTEVNSKMLWQWQMTQTVQDSVGTIDKQISRYAIRFFAHAWVGVSNMTTLGS